MANTLTFANQTLTDANIFGGISYIADLNTGEEFSIGNTASASVKFLTDVQLPLYTKDQTNGTFTWTRNSVARGRYYITEVTKVDGKYQVTAYDAMILLETSISTLSISFPTTVSSLASDIATLIGCTVSGTVVNGNCSTDELDPSMTVRQLLGYIAEASGCSVKIDGADHLCFMYYAASGITVTASDYVKLDAADYTCAAIDRVEIYNNVGALQASSGAGTNTLYISHNPFLNEATATEAAAILAVVGFTYTPLTCEMFDENGLEVGVTATFGSASTLVMHIESDETGAVASSVGSDSRAEYNKSLEDLAVEAITVANDAAATGLYFWHTATDTGAGAGAHITQEEKAQFITDVGNDPTSGGGNVLIDSNGLKVRDGLTELATFGASGVQIGQTGEANLQMDYHSLQMVDKDGNVFMQVSDLRNSSGIASLSETFTGDGSTTSFTVTYVPSATTSVEINGTATSAYTLSNKTYTFTTAPASGDDIVITYETTSQLAKAYTLGTRNSSEKVGSMSIAEGYSVIASGARAHASGSGTKASGTDSHAEGSSTRATGSAAHSEGAVTSATGTASHAEGINTYATESYAHAEGSSTRASGLASHAEGCDSVASAPYSHAQNIGTKASSDYQTAIGMYNVEDDTDTYAFIIGNGTDDNARSNALTVDWSGNVAASGDIEEGTGKMLSRTPQGVEFAVTAGTTKTLSVPNNSAGFIVVSGAHNNNQNIYIYNVSSSGTVTLKAMGTASNITTSTSTRSIAFTSASYAARYIVITFYGSIPTVS